MALLLRVPRVLSPSIMPTSIGSSGIRSACMLSSLPAFTCPLISPWLASSSSLASSTSVSASSVSVSVSSLSLADSSQHLRWFSLRNDVTSQTPLSQSQFPPSSPSMSALQLSSLLGRPALVNNYCVDGAQTQKKVDEKIEKTTREKGEEGNSGGGKHEPDDDEDDDDHLASDGSNRKLSWWRQADWYVRGQNGKYALAAVMGDVDEDFNESAFLEGACDALCAVTERLGDISPKQSADTLKSMVGSRMYQAMRKTAKEYQQQGLKTTHVVDEILRCQVTQVQVVPQEERDLYEWNEDEERVRDIKSSSDPHKDPDWDAGAAAGSPPPGSQSGWFLGSLDSTTDDATKEEVTARHLLIHVRYFVRETVGLYDISTDKTVHNSDRYTTHTLIFARGPLPIDDDATDEERRRKYDSLPWVVLDLH